MARKDILVISPSIEWAKKRWEESCEYIRQKFPSGGTIAIKRLNITIGEEGHRIRFISEGLQEQATMGFRGVVMTEGNHLQAIDKIIEEVIEHDKMEPAQVEGINVLVICSRYPEPIFEKFAEEIRSQFDSYQLRRSDYTIIVKPGNHKIRFGYESMILDNIRDGFNDVILTEKSFEKYKSRILEAIK
ncbi:MAG: hypothetical protein NC548_13235 [Lachnospiraceae bacterium]|nr:hypothetical protein [Lachnospiraceae bacterium]MCM1230646.1 hypothetical protein [Ruminococcus flavefaciens]MCM1439998.1 hypothetical protein [Roseburia sp.]